MDRQVIAILKPELAQQFHWSEVDYSNIVFCFQLAYAAGYLVAGRAMDRFGIRLGYATCVVLWSVAAMAHGAARSVAGFSVARGALGFAEGGGFPAAVKVVAEWHPKAERALATGIFNAGSNVGALLAPLLVPWVTLRWGWPAAFIFVGALGFLWLLVWLPVYRPPAQHPQLSQAERAYIESDRLPTPASVPWSSLLRYRQTWAFVAGMALTAPVWWFYLFWIPDFLHKQFGLDLLHLGAPLVVIYLMADVGSIGGGWLSSRLIRTGRSVNFSRKAAMLLCALLVLPVISVPMVTSLWGATLLVGLAASAHQGFAANLYTLVSDTAPSSFVGSIVGIGGMAAALGGMVVAKVTGYVLEWTQSYHLLFVGAAIAYLIALLCIHLLNPRLAPIATREA